MGERCKFIHGPFVVQCESKPGHDGSCKNEELIGGEFNHPGCEHEAEGAPPSWCMDCGVDMPANEPPSDDDVPHDQDGDVGW